MVMILEQRDWRGGNGKTDVKRLPPDIGARVVDADVQRGSLRGVRACDVVHTLSETLLSQQISLYRMGRAAPSDTAYWLTSSADVDYMPSLLANDPNEVTYFTDGTKPRYTDTTLIGGSEPYPAASVTLGVPAPTSSMVATLNTAGSGTTTEARVYLDTFMRPNGDESQPNPNTTSITVVGGSTVDLGTFSSVPSGSHGITKRRIYVSTDGGPFLRVAEVTTGTTTVTDTGTRGLTLETGGDPSIPAWLEPPDDLVGLLTLWGGMAGGFSGNAWRVCVPFKPHAWPIEYRGVLPGEIVGSAAWGRSWLLLTTNTPHLVTGSTPSGMVSQPVYFEAACVSKRSVAGVQHGVCWAAPQGLCYYGQNGAANLTLDTVELADWQALDPTSIIGVNWGRWYIGFYDNGTTSGGFMVDTMAPTSIIWLTQDAKGAWLDRISDAVYMLDAGNVIRKWDSGDELAPEWLTGIRRFVTETNPGAMRVVAESYPVTVEGIADGVTRFTVNVANENPVRLPGGYLARNFQAKITGAAEALFIAHEIADLP